MDQQEAAASAAKTLDVLEAGEQAVISEVGGSGTLRQHFLDMGVIPGAHEEIVSRQFIIDEKPTGIINIVDATNIERKLYLTMQLMELDVPMVLELNMMDEVRGNGGSVRINEMEEMLGIPVVPISASRNEGHLHRGVPARHRLGRGACRLSRRLWNRLGVDGTVYLLNNLR